MTTRKRFTFEEVKAKASSLGVRVAKGTRMFTPWGWKHTEYCWSHPEFGSACYKTLREVMGDLDYIEKELRDNKRKR